MSHTIRVKKVQITDMHALQAAIRDNPDITLVKPGTLKEADDIESATGKHTLYGGVSEGIGVKLAGWQYPVVIAEGGINFDNYSGRWGDMDELDGFVQAYTVEKTRQEAMQANLMIATENTMEDGSIELVCSVDGQY